MENRSQVSRESKKSKCALKGAHICEYVREWVLPYSAYRGDFRNGADDISHFWPTPLSPIFAPDVEAGGTLTPLSAFWRRYIPFWGRIEGFMYHLTRFGAVHAWKFTIHEYLSHDMLTRKMTIWHWNGGSTQRGHVLQDEIQRVEVHDQRTVEASSIGRSLGSVTASRLVLAKLVTDVINDKLGTRIKVTRGVAQGSVLKPLFFGVCIDDREQILTWLRCSQ